MRQLRITNKITKRDELSLDKYLQEVNKYKILSIEEEVDLAIRAKNGDSEAMNQLINCNLRFVVSVAKQYTSGWSSLADLINEGNLGLIKAAHRFDATRGFKFISYAVWWIRQSITQFLAENGRSIRLPLNRVGMYQNLKKAESELEQILFRPPSIQELSDYLNDKRIDKNQEAIYTIEAIEELYNNGYNLASLDAPMSSDSDSGSLLDITPNNENTESSEEIHQNDLQIEIKRRLKQIPHRESIILTKYFGLFGERQMTLEEIGSELHLTRERVRQLKEKAVKHIRRKSTTQRLKQYL